MPEAEIASLQDEIAMVRVYIRRFIEMGEDAVQTYPESLVHLRSICHATTSLNPLVKTEYMLRGPTDPVMIAFDQALQEVVQEMEIKNNPGQKSR